MTDNELKQIITMVEANSTKDLVKEEVDHFTSQFIKYLPTGISIKNMLPTGFQMCGIYLANKTVELALDYNYSIDNSAYQNALVFDITEASLILMGATKISKSTHGISFEYLDYNYHLELKSNYLTPCEYATLYKKQIEEFNKDYTIFKNTLALINYFINEEGLKLLNTYLIINLLMSGLKNEQLDNKYYKYLNIFQKALDELLNSKRFEMSECFDNEVLMQPNLTETKLAEYRVLRRAIAKAITLEEEQIKFDSQTEVIIDVNPVVLPNNLIAWHYELLGRSLESMGGEYQNTLENQQTAILKGVFRGLRCVVDNNLTKKKIILKCDLKGILSDTMLSNDENKSRMKTIKKLIEEKNLKIQETK